MFMKKKRIALLITIALTAALFAGCGKKADIVPLEKVSTVSETETPTPTPTETPTPTPTKTPTPTPTKTPTPTPTPTYDEVPESFVLYISGIDVWGALETQSRSDVNLLAAVNRKTGKIQLVNTPRELQICTRCITSR